MKPAESILLTQKPILCTARWQSGSVTPQEESADMRAPITIEDMRKFQEE